MIASVITLIIVTALMVACFFYVVEYIVDKRYRYTYDSRNHFRRWCRKCGNCQTMWEDAAHSWWSVNGRNSDDTCPCNNDTEDQ